MDRREYKDAKGGGIVYGPSPRVSCVMPTRNRPEFVASAIECFLRQDYDGEIELAILDDSDERLQYLPPYPPGGRWLGIRYIWRDPAHFGVLNTGAKRNAVNELARGDVIVHWDDDDWNHPHRVQDQIDFLLKTGKQVVGYHNYFYFCTADRTVFKYDDPSFRPHSGGSALCYRRDFWAKHRFEARAVGEDFCFTVQARRRDEMASKDGCPYLVARAHGGNSCFPKFGTAKFPAVSLAELPEEFLLTANTSSRTIEK